MKKAKLFSYVFIILLALTFLVDALEAGSEATALIVVIISSLIFVAASLKTKNLREK